MRVTAGIKRYEVYFSIMKKRSLLVGIVIVAGMLLPGAKAFAEKQVVVLQATDTLDVPARPIGTVTAGSEDQACSYTEILEVLREKASRQGANLVKITRRRERSRSQACEYAEAAIYRVDDPQRWEAEFSWSSGRRLQWSDFRGAVPEGKGRTAAETACGIGFETNSVTGNGPVIVNVYNSFSTVDSWVRPGVTNPEVLSHEQGHFDLCEIYTRRLRERVSKLHLTGRTMKTVLPQLYDKLQQEYIERQQEYEEETRHGIDEQQQRRWQLRIADELDETSAWSSTGKER